VDPSYTTELANLIFNKNNAAILDTASLYDFQITELKTGTQITLADTANVENQLIEYMKFRGPVELAGEMDGFLRKIKEMLTIKDMLAVAVEKNEIRNRYENPKDGEPLSKEAAQLIQDINTFAIKLYNYSVDPEADVAEAGKKVEKSAKKNPYRLKNATENFDNKIKSIMNTIGSPEDTYCDELSQAMTELRAEMKKNKDKEISLSQDYFLDDKEKTRNFTEVNLKLNENRNDIINLAENVKNAAESREGEHYQTYIKACKKAKENYEQAQRNAEEKEKEELTAAKQELVNTVKKIEGNAGTLYLELKSLRDRLERVFVKYESYIKEMEQKVAEHKNDKKYQDYLIQYEPDIELAKANGGELVKNLDVLLNSRQYLLQISDGYPDENGNLPREKLSGWIGEAAAKVIDSVINLTPEAPAGSPVFLTSRIKNYKYKDASGSENLYQNPYVAASGELFSDMQGDLCILFSHASYYYRSNYRSDVDVRVGEEVTKDDVSKNGEKALKELTGLDKLDKQAVRENPDWLTVNYQTTAGVPTGLATEFETGEVDEGFLTKVLDLGTNLLAGLGTMLENARDNLYVDAYVMSMFPNYKVWKDWKEGNIKEEEMPKYFQPPYEADNMSYNASYAAVEYIITGKGGGDGKGFGQASVEAIRLKLFGTRMMFNSLSILLDTAKIRQAQSLALAMLGPFAPLAPLVTVVLLAAWAAAESVLDVMVLMGEQIIKGENPEEGVLIYKGGKDWYFSVNGVVKLGVGMALDKLGDKAVTEAEKLIGGFEKKMNVMIYEAYTSTQDSVDEIFKEMRIEEAGEIVTWTKELTKNLGELEGVPKGGLTPLNQGLGKAKAAFESAKKVKKQVDASLFTVKEQAAMTVSRLSHESIDLVKKGVKELNGNVKKVIGENLHKVLPVGEVVNTGSKGERIRMTYEDYLYFYLFTMNGEKKVERIQSVIQANLRAGGIESFSMERSPVSVYADLECSMRYLFLSDGIVPQGLKKDGRLRFKVISAQSY